jgi:hypothetical protein
MLKLEPKNLNISFGAAFKSIQNCATTSVIGGGGGVGVGRAYHKQLYLDSIDTD